MHSVYLTYRRGVGTITARAIFHDLRANGSEAFMDAETERGEQYETVALNQIAAHPYFLIVLTPGTLERCAEPGDWLRRQIERAQALKRRIVPLLSPQSNIDELRGQPFGAQLIGEKPLILEYDALPQSMAKLRLHTLKPVDLPITPTPDADRGLVVRALEADAPIKREHLAAQAHFERAFTRRRDDWEGRIADYSEAIRLYPEFAEAYARRGANRDVKGDLDGALADLNEAIRLNPRSDVAYVNRGILRVRMKQPDIAMSDYDAALRINPALVAAYYHRGLLREEQNDLGGAIADLDAAIRLDPSYAPSYFYRALAHHRRGDLEAALADHTEAIRLNPQLAEAYYNRGLIRAQVDLQGAVADWTEAIRLDPKLAEAYYNRGLVRANWGDMDGTIADMLKFLELLPDSQQAGEVQAMIERLKQMKGQMKP